MELTEFKELGKRLIKNSENQEWGKVFSERQRKYKMLSKYRLSLSHFFDFLSF